MVCTTFMTGNICSEEYLFSLSMFLQGFRGPNGATGSQGAKGGQGERGVDGSNIMGATGATGSTGIFGNMIFIASHSSVSSLHPKL